MATAPDPSAVPPLLAIRPSRRAHESTIGAWSLALGASEDAVRLHTGGRSGELQRYREFAKSAADFALRELTPRSNSRVAKLGAIYVTAVDQRVVVVHAFTKKTQKTSQRTLETARARAKEVEWGL